MKGTVVISYNFTLETGERTVKECHGALSVRPVLGNKYIDAFKVLCEFEEGDVVDVYRSWDVSLVLSNLLGVSR
jgi:hypothetical protein